MGQFSSEQVRDAFSGEEPPTGGKGEGRKAVKGGIRGRP